MSKEILPGHQRSTNYAVEDVRDGQVTLKRTGDQSTLPERIFPVPIRQGHRVTICLIVESPHTRNEWARAYAEQGLSDLGIYKLLTETKPPIAACHWLHYLQMASEKIGKANQFLVAGESIDKLVTSHIAAVRFVDAYFKSSRMRTKYRGKDAELQEKLRDMAGVARAIEELAPAIDRERVPQNVEYPWSDGTKLFIPSKHQFTFEELPKAKINEFVIMLEEAASMIP